MMDSGLPCTFTAAEAMARGVSRRALKRMLCDGAVERIGHGLYRRAGYDLVDYDLAKIAVRAHQPTLCLLSALARHELTDVIPSIYDVALPRGAWQPRMSIPVRWHKFDASTFDIGRDEVRVDDAHSIGVYNAPRSIVDAFRLRRDVGPDIANEALRRWLRQRGEPAELMRVTNSFPAARSVILHALHVLL